MVQRRYCLGSNKAILIHIHPYGYSGLFMTQPLCNCQSRFSKRQQQNTEHVDALRSAKSPTMISTRHFSLSHVDMSGEDRILFRLLPDGSTFFFPMCWFLVHVCWLQTVITASHMYSYIFIELIHSKSYTTYFFHQCIMVSKHINSFSFIC